MTMIRSPNTVLANSLDHALHILRPRIKINKPEEIIFSVGTQINGIPHIGTYIVQCASFILARETRKMYGIDTSVEFGALDNAPHDIVKSASGYVYQRNYYHALSQEALRRLIETYYTSFFGGLQELTEVPYTSIAYSETQHSPDFRRVFLKTLESAEMLRWCVSPSQGNLRIRIPCPKCHYAEKYSERTKLLHCDEHAARFRCMCLKHGVYDAIITADGKDDVYLDLNTVYRNVVKEAVCSERSGKLYVMVKGGDWVFSTQMVDWALGVLGYSAIQTPMRIFTPQVVTETGAKLSKSLIREGDVTLEEVPEWILDMGKFAENNPDYIEYVIWLVEQFLSHPRHMYRSYTYQEVIRILKSRQGNQENVKE